VNKRRLGRGLEALLGRDEGGFDPGSFDSTDLIYVPVDQIDANPFQPRRQFDAAEISALADSLRQHGMLQPILIRSAGERYQLIAGERRLRASLEAQLHEIPARVLDLDDQRVFELAMVENLQREDLGPLEKATAFRDYLARYGGTQEELAGRLGLDRSTIANLIRLLDLPAEVHDALGAKKITAGHARALLGLPDHDAQRGACQRVIAEGLSVRQTEALVATGEPTPARPRLRVDQPEPRGDDGGVKPPHFVELEQQLHARFGTAVLIRARTADRGQIIIPYNSQEEFNRVASLIRG
jgi:ParB family chromosome partitioning protein